jgi:ABC-type antimicrobial peptide transport system permease subunit
MALTRSVFATWVLSQRRVLLGTDRVLAAKIGLAFSAMTTTGMLSVADWAGMGRSAYVGALVNGALCVVAAILLVRARRRLEALSRRRRELERHLGLNST